MNPEVSVIIPTYNSEEFIEQALISVLNQSYCHLEVILVDDASTDLSVKIARSFQDSRLKIIENNRNRGVSHSRNCGIREAKGKWIALLDSDDWYAPQRIEKLLTLAEARNADLVADDLFLVNDGEQQCWSTLLSESSYRQSSPISMINAVKFAMSDRLLAINAPRNWSLGYIKPLIRRDFLLKNGILYDETVNVGEDFILYLECLRHQAKFYLLAQPYYHYRTRVSSLSTRKPTEYLFQSCEITASFINREMGSPAESPLLQVLSQNLMIFQKRLEYHRLIEKIKQKKLIAAIKHLLNHPYILADLRTKSMMILKNRLRTIIRIQSTAKKVSAHCEISTYRSSDHTEEKNSCKPLPDKHHFGLS